MSSTEDLDPCRWEIEVFIPPGVLTSSRLQIKSSCLLHTSNFNDRRTQNHSSFKRNNLHSTLMYASCPLSWLITSSPLANTVARQICIPTPSSTWLLLPLVQSPSPTRLLWARTSMRQKSSSALSRAGVRNHWMQYHLSHLLIVPNNI